MGQAASLRAGIAVGADQEDNRHRGRFAASEIEAGGGTIDRLGCAVVIISARCPCARGKWSAANERQLINSAQDSQKTKRVSNRGTRYGMAD
jgi:hypothetical protein